MSARVTIRFAAAVAAALVALAPAAVSAAPGSGGGGGSGGTVDDILVAYVSYTRPGAGGGGGGPTGCTWDEIVGGLAENGFGPTWPRERDGVTYRLWIRKCGQQVDAYEVPDVDPRDLLPELLERLRTRTLPSPTPVFEKLDPQNQWAYVRVPVDFRAGGNSWRPVSVTASIGPIWATVTAEPSTLSFDSGDQASPEQGATCAGDAPIADYIAEQPGECSFTYINASSTSTLDGHHFETTMTIDWDISWTSSTGAGGALDGFSTSTTAPLAVAEVKGIVTCTGSRPQEGGC
jgi:hypothetical protein